MFLCDVSMKGGEKKSYIAFGLPSLFLKFPLVPSCVKATNTLTTMTSPFDKSHRTYSLIHSLYHLVYVIVMH